MKLLPLLCLLTQDFGPTSAQEIRPGVVTVSEGADVILPCALDSGHNIDQFDWKKDNREEEKEVFFYKEGTYYGDGLQGQSEQFKGRVDFFKDELKSGNASIKIRDTRLEDNGTYTCVLFKPQTHKVNIRLNVGAAREPHVKTILDKIYWRLLECKVEGVPKPLVEWRDSAGKVSAKENVKESQDTSGRFLVKLQLNVTRSDSYTCVATQRDIYHQINNTLEVSILGKIPEPEFPTALVIAVAVSIVFSLLIGFLIGYFYKKHQIRGHCERTNLNTGI